MILPPSYFILTWQSSKLNIPLDLSFQLHKQLSESRLEDQKVDIIRKKSMDGDGVISYDLNRGNQKNLSYNEK
jgi:hypothetical protein